MKRVAMLCIVVWILGGCSETDVNMERGIALRQKILSAQGCSFDVDITADYGDKLYSFSMACSGNAQGEIDFSVTAPESIAGISGSLSSAGGLLTFDDAALQFDLMADLQLSPVSAPWVFLNTLRGGYIRFAGMEEEMLRLTLDDSYREDALQVDVWIDRDNIPVRGEILHEGRRILTVSVHGFQLL